MTFSSCIFPKSPHPIVESGTLALSGFGDACLKLANQLGQSRNVIIFEPSKFRARITQSLVGRSKVAVTQSPDCLEECHFWVLCRPLSTRKTMQSSNVEQYNLCETVGTHLPLASTLIFDSSFTKAATCSFCLPTIERISNLVANRDFFVGYAFDESRKAKSFGDRNRDSTPTHYDETPIVGAAVRHIYKDLITSDETAMPKFGAVAAPAQAQEDYYQVKNLRM